VTDSRRLLVVDSALAECERVSALSPAEVATFLKFGVPVYWADVLHQSLAASHPPQWCGAFALWNLHKAGLGLELRWMFGPPHFGFLWNLRELAPHQIPEPGDIAYLDKPYQHHAVVVCVEGDTVHTVDGNQGALQPIQKHEHPLGRWTAFFSIAPLLTEPEPVA
jgi:hypothetical protein